MDNPFAQFAVPQGMAVEKDENPFAQFALPNGGGKAETGLDYLEGVAQSAGQGALLGFGDEIAAALGAVGGMLPGGHGKGYGEVLSDVRGKGKKFSDDHPYVSLGAEVAGGIGSLAGAPVRAVAAAPSMLGRVGRSAAIGGGFGAASGFGNSEGDYGNRLVGATKGGAVGAVAGPLIADVALPLAARTASGVNQAFRYGNQAIRNARNPQQAAIENVADRLTAAGIDPAAVRGAVSPPPSPQLAGRNTPAGQPFSDEDMATIISRSMRGDTAAQIGADYGIHPGTVSRYVATYRDTNPTPMSILDVSKEIAGEGGASPVTRLGRAAYSLAGDESGDAAQRLIGRQDTQAGRVGNIVQRSVAGGDFEATRTAGLQGLRDEADTAYRQFYAEPELAIDQLRDLMQDPLFRRANVMGQRQARVEAIRRNQDAARAGRPQESVPTVDPNNEVFTPEMLDLIQRQLRIASQGAVSNPNAARHAGNLRQVFLDRIEDHYPTFRGIRRNYAEGMGEFGEEGALDAGAAMTTRLGAPAREALRGFGAMTPAQQELFRLGFARSLMDKAANPQIGGAVANQFNTTAVRELVEQLYPRGNRQLWQQGQRLLRDLRRESITTKTKNDVLAGARTAELGSDMGRMMEGAQTAADVATGRWGKLLENLSTRLSTQLGRRGAQEVLDVLTQTDPAQLLPVLNRLAQASTTTRQRQAYAAAIREIRSGAFARAAPASGVAAGNDQAIGRK